jgi:hypothetical protein
VRAADSQCGTSGVVVHLPLPHSGWINCVPMDEDHVGTTWTMGRMSKRAKEKTISS